MIDLLMKAHREMVGHRTNLGLKALVSEYKASFTQLAMMGFTWFGWMG